MPATPAWPPRSLPRLFVRTLLTLDAAVPLDEKQANYLGNVMRLGIGDSVQLFDGATGEWRARIVDSGRKRMVLMVEQQTSPVESVPDLWLAFAPVKRAPVEWLVEKATELGVARLLPVTTARTVVERLRLDRLLSIAIEAAEQCGRTVLPLIDEPVSLDKFLAARAVDRALIFADEQGGTSPSRTMTAGPATILIGPEGGFTDPERLAIRAAPNAIAITLGPRILRAETAALAAVTAWMALAGDWRSEGLAPPQGDS